jgi:hypothetical protein
MKHRSVLASLLAFVTLSCDEPLQPPPPQPEVLSVSIAPTDTTVDVADPAIPFTITV